MKIKAIINSGIQKDDVFHAHFFWVVENVYGKFVLNWTAMNEKELKHRKFPPMAAIKRQQLGCLSADWLDASTPIIVRQVVSGSRGSIEYKIRDILERTKSGQRVLIALESNDLDGHFYKALDINPRHFDTRLGKQFIGMMQDYGLSISLPFEIANFAESGTYLPS